MKIFRIYFAAAAVCMMLTAAIGGIIEAENNTRRVAFGEEGALPMVSFSVIEELIKNPDG
ncbi:MAG: hypothetical protein IJB45_00125 [Clostridia bacterium]|nr:hypothetical protein [Clostridia bacterium]